jgi:hypothetical protein
MLQRGLGETFDAIFTYLSHVRGCPGCLVIDSDLAGRVFLCVSIGCGFSMQTRGDSPKLVGSI